MERAFGNFRPKQTLSNQLQMAAGKSLEAVAIHVLLSEGRELDRETEVSIQRLSAFVFCGESKEHTQWRTRDRVDSGGGGPRRRCDSEGRSEEHTSELQSLR